ncbi:MAG: hypothetical protein ACOY4T_05215 [Pseudomonadota bacterium]|jgi:hypothetical protein
MRNSLGAGIAGAQRFGAACLPALSSVIPAGGALGDRLGVARRFRGVIVPFAEAGIGTDAHSLQATRAAVAAVAGIAAACALLGAAIAAFGMRRPPQASARR